MIIKELQTDSRGKFELYKRGDLIKCPKISVVMSVYNGEEYVWDAIESTLNQTYGNFAFIIINDGSNDGTFDILMKCLEQDNRIVVINQENIGLTKSLNRALRIIQIVSKHIKYIARIDADDIWCKEKLQKQVRFFEKNCHIGLVGSMYEEIDRNGNIVCAQKVCFIEADKDIRNNIFRFNPFFHSSVMFRQKILNTIGVYNEEFQYAQDYEYWIRIMSKYKVANLSECLASRRYTKNMISISKEKSQRYYAVKAKLLAIKLLKLPSISYLYLLNDLMVILLPRPVVTAIRIIKNHYSHLTLKLT
jgi:glycosyltransferase involved in cell wall biosynthesis